MAFDWVSPESGYCICTLPANSEALPVAFDSYRYAWNTTLSMRCDSVLGYSRSMDLAVVVGEKKGEGREVRVEE